MLRLVQLSQGEANSIVCCRSVFTFLRWSKTEKFYSTKKSKLVIEHIDNPKQYFSYNSR